MGEKLAIVSPKVQTTRHRIKGILSGKDYQVIFSDTPGIIEPRYKLHEKMMDVVKQSLEDADLALLLADIWDNAEENDQLFAALRLKSPAIVVLNKMDGAAPEKIKEAEAFFAPRKSYCRKVLVVSALPEENRIFHNCWTKCSRCCRKGNPSSRGMTCPICPRSSLSAR